MMSKIMSKKGAITVLCFGAFLAILGNAPGVLAQGRVNDKDLQNLMRNLRDASKSFQPAFDDSIRHSVIRKTSQEKNAKKLVSHFVKQTDQMLNKFRRTRNANDEMRSVLDSAARVNKIVYDIQLNPQTVSRWETVRSALHQVASAYGVEDSIR